MFTGAKSSKSKAAHLDSEKVKDSAAALVAAVSDAGSQASVIAGRLAHQAKESASQAKDWSDPRVHEFRDWLTPRLEKAWEDSRRAAAPHVEKAAEKAGPKIDVAHDKLVEEYLPRLVATFSAATAAAAAKASTSAETAAESFTKAADAVASKHGAAAKEAAARAAKSQKSGKGKTFWFLAGTAAAAGGAYAVWRKSQPEVDPWAEPWEKVDSAESSDSGVVADVKEKVTGAAAAATAAVKDAKDGFTKDSDATPADDAPPAAGADKVADTAAAKADAPAKGKTGDTSKPTPATTPKPSVMKPIAETTDGSDDAK